MIDFIRTTAGRKSRRGAIALEYALVLAFVAVAVLAALVSLSGKLTTTINTVGSKVDTAAANKFDGS